MKESLIANNTIAVIRRLGEENNNTYSNLKDIEKIIAPLNKNKKRNWFSSHFYKCLPLSIGNMQGFVVQLPFEFDVFWNGGSLPEDISFVFYEDEKKEKFKIEISSHFGNGVFTINLPFILKTPENVNLMTMSPPNFPTPGLSPLAAVVETDNLKYTFGLSIKVDIPNTWIKVLPNTPLVGLLPVPRFFCDQFVLVDGDKTIDTVALKEEKEVAKDHGMIRGFLSSTDSPLDKTYFFGTDIRGNKFKNHQLPKKGK